MSDTTRPQYTCAECRGVFIEGWTDEEAQAECVKNFGVRGDAQIMAKVCDDCYKKIMAVIRRAANGFSQ